MRQRQSSMTATGIAAVRAVESLRPADERICDDPYARRFISRLMFQATRFFVATGYAEWRGPGVMGYLAGRCRVIDDELETQLGQGLAQMVILGAGYDSRAYRFNALRGRVKVFEVDHPATQREKVEKVTRIFGKPPAHVTFVPVDFNTTTLDEALRACGYDASRKTLFIWEGVTMYLTAEGVDNTLAFVAHHSTPGSRIIFDYIYKSVLENAAHAEVRGMRRYRALLGEGLTFGIEKGQVATFLEARGFCDITDMPSERLKQMYFKGANAGRAVVPGYAVVSAAVCPRSL